MHEQLKAAKQKPKIFLCSTSTSNSTSLKYQETKTCDKMTLVDDYLTFEKYIHIGFKKVGLYFLESSAPLISGVHVLEVEPC